MQSRLPIALALLAVEFLTCATWGGGALGVRAAAGAGAASGSESSDCPATLPANPLSSRRGATLVLVPAGASSLLLCSYRGLNPISHSGKLERKRTVTAPSELRRLTHEFDMLPDAPKLVFCPMDDGSAILATFSYAEAPSNPVSVGLTGCQIATNGHVSRTAARPPGPALVAQLTALLD